MLTAIFTALAVIVGLLSIVAAAPKVHWMREQHHRESARDVAVGLLFSAIAIVFAFLAGRWSL